MYEKLLVAVDHSKATERVLGAARDLAALSGGEVWVLHLREREILPKAGGIVASDEFADAAQAQVDSAVGELTKAGIKAHGVLRSTLYGYAAREIVEDAKKCSLAAGSSSGPSPGSASAGAPPATTSTCPAAPKP